MIQDGLMGDGSSFAARPAVSIDVGDIGVSSLRFGEFVPSDASIDDGRPNYF
jgi:hypothetical protein